MSICVYVCAVVEGMFTCKTEPFEKEVFVFVFMLLWGVCKRLILGILANTLLVNVCVFVEGMYICTEGIYTCKTRHFGNKPLLVCFNC